MEEPSRAELLAEAYKRGLLPPDMKETYEEAMRRGLVGPAQSSVDVGNEIMAAPSAVNRFVAATLGAPVDASNWIARQFGLTDATNPIGGSESIKSGMDALGMRTDIHAKTTPGRIGEHAGTAIAAAVPVMAAGRIAQGATQLPTVVREVGRVLGADAPLQTIASGAAGVGEGVAAELWPDNELAQFGGGLAGGAVGGAVLAPFADAIAQLLGHAARPFFQKGRETILGNTLERLTSGDIERTPIEGAPQVAMPGARQTAAQETLDTGLAAAERAMRNDPKFGSLFTLRDAEQSATRRGVLNDIAPGRVGGGAEETAGIVGQRVEDFRDASSIFVENAKRKVQDRLAGLPPKTPEEQTGRIIQEELGKAYQQMQTLRDNAALPKLDQALASEAAVNTKHLLRTVDRMLANEKRTPVIQALNEVRGKLFVPGTDDLDTSVAGLYETRKAINDIIAGRGENPVARYAKSQLIEFRDTLDRAVNRAESIFGEYLKTYKNESARYVAPFEREAAATPKVLDRDQFNQRFVMAPEKVADEYWNRGATGMREFLDVSATSGGAQDAMANAITTSLREYATNPDGTVNGTRWLRWLNDNKEALGVVPGLRDQFSSVSKAQATLDSLLGRQQRTLADVERGAAGYFLKNNPTDAIERILNSGNSLRLLDDLIAKVGRAPLGMPALRRSFMDAALKSAETATVDQTGAKVLSNAGLISFLKDHRAEAAKLFSPGHLQTIEAVIEDAQRSAFSGSGGKVAGSNTVQNLTVANLLNRTTLGAFKDMSGALGSTVGRALSFLYKFPEERIQEMFVESLLNPETARMLRAKASPENVGRWWKVMAERTGVTTAVTTGQALMPGSEQPKE